MTVSHVSSTFVPLAPDPTRTHNNGPNIQQVQSEFSQLGQDLQAGNITQAQQDFATLSKNFPGLQQGASAAGASNSPASQAFSALEQALQSGDAAGAQTAFATFQQDFQAHVNAQNNPPPPGASDHTHNDPIARAADSLSQALQAGNLPAAQSAFAALQQELQQRLFAGSTASNSNSNTKGPGTALNITV
jgi:hypothetical protein